MSKINLEEFAGGALQEKFDTAMEQVLKNMTDPNTPWKNKRGITIEVTFEQNEDRDDASVGVAVKTKLAAVKPIGTRMSIGKNLQTGELYAAEYGNQIRGQMSMEEYQKQKESEKAQEPDTPSNQENDNNVVDFRAAKQA